VVGSLKTVASELEKRYQILWQYKMPDGMRLVISPPTVTYFYIRRENAEDLGVDGKIILYWIIGKWDGKMWTGFTLLITGTSGGSCEHGNETSGFIKGEEFLD